MPKYFNYFPLTEYSLSNTTSSMDVVTNILSKFKYEDGFTENTAIYYKYEVTDGETPEILAYKIYGSSEKHWIILSLNNIVNPLTDWPLNQNSLNNLIDIKYSTSEYANNSTQYAGVNWAQSNNHSYYRIETQTNLFNNQKFINTTQIDDNTYANLVSSTNSYTLNNGYQIKIDIDKYVKTYYEYEIEENEKKRTIKILKSEFIPAVESEFQKVISNE
jgi:hypothetical protein